MVLLRPVLATECGRVNTRDLRCALHGHHSHQVPRSHHSHQVHHVHLSHHAVPQQLYTYLVYYKTSVGCYHITCVRD